MKLLISLFSYQSPQKTLDMSALTLSFLPSCVNTNMVGVKNIYTKKKKKETQSSSGAVIIPFTMHSHDRLSLLISDSSQEDGCRGSIRNQPVMVAKAVNTFLTI